MGTAAIKTQNEKKEELLLPFSFLLRNHRRRMGAKQPQEKNRFDITPSN